MIQYRTLAWYSRPTLCVVSTMPLIYSISESRIETSSSGETNMVWFSQNLKCVPVRKLVTSPSQSYLTGRGLYSKLKLRVWSVVGIILYHYVLHCDRDVHSHIQIWINLRNIEPVLKMRVNAATRGTSSSMHFFQGGGVPPLGDLHGQHGELLLLRNWPSTVGNYTFII